MRSLFIATFCLVSLILSACGPTFNWRDTSIAETELTALFPCKPLKASRRLYLGRTEVDLHMASCNTGGVTVAIGHASVPEAAETAGALQKWREATLAGMRAKSSSSSPLVLAGVDQGAHAARTQALGIKPGGGEIVLEAAWFARGNEIFGALMYGAAPSPDVVETFFSSLKFR